MPSSYNWNLTYEREVGFNTALIVSYVGRRGLHGQREKNIKHWPREWKINLIVRENPLWQDLYDEIAR